MIKIENSQVMGWEAAIRGMRNPMNSWNNSDSRFQGEDGSYYDLAGVTWPTACGNEPFRLGPNDMDLMLRLAKAGSVDGKFRRMIVVYVDITAPLYWWKEFDTYKVGTVANSCSTMHKIHAKEFTLDDFSHEHLIGFWEAPLRETIEMLNVTRELYAESSNKDKELWYRMIQLLPSSYNQKRTVMLNYEVLANIYKHRRRHKLDEWRELCKWIEDLPYSEIITCNVAEKENTNDLTAALAKLRAEQWSDEQIAKLLLGHSKKEQLKIFADDGDTTPVHHGGCFDIPSVMADESKGS